MSLAGLLADTRLTVPGVIYRAAVTEDPVSKAHVASYTAQTNVGLRCWLTRRKIQSGLRAQDQGGEERGQYAGKFLLTVDIRKGDGFLVDSTSTRWPGLALIAVDVDDPLGDYREVGFDLVAREAFT